MITKISGYKVFKKYAFFEKLDLSHADTEGYEEFVQHPIDMDKIRAALQAGEYEDIVEVKLKIAQIFQNCQAFNHEWSNEYKAASTMLKRLQPL